MYNTQKQSIGNTLLIFSISISASIKFNLTAQCLDCIATGVNLARLSARDVVKLKLEVGVDSQTALETRTED